MNILKKDRPKTAFVTHSGKYQYTRMPFGPTKTLASFQRALDTIITTYKSETCFVYPDDIVIFSSSIGDYIGHDNNFLYGM